MSLTPEEKEALDALLAYDVKPTVDIDETWPRVVRAVAALRESRTKWKPLELGIAGPNEARIWNFSDVTLRDRVLRLLNQDEERQ